MGHIYSCHLFLRVCRPGIFIPELPLTVCHPGQAFNLCAALSCDPDLVRLGMCRAQGDSRCSQPAEEQRALCTSIVLPFSPFLPRTRLPPFIRTWESIRVFICLWHFSSKTLLHLALCLGSLTSSLLPLHIRPHKGSPSHPLRAWAGTRLLLCVPSHDRQTSGDF